MIAVPKLDAYRINANGHQDGEGGAPSLDVIASAHYGRQYVAQQTGDMLSNGSWTEYVMDKAGVEQELYEPEPIPEDRYVYGRSRIRKWLELDESAYHYDFEVYRQAPTPHTILADLIDKGELPYGTYLLYCWW